MLLGVPNVFSLPLKTQRAPQALLVRSPPNIPGNAQRWSPPPRIHPAGCPSPSLPLGHLPFPVGPSRPTVTGSSRWAPCSPCHPDVDTGSISKHGQDEDKLEQKFTKGLTRNLTVEQKHMKTGSWSSKLQWSLGWTLLLLALSCTLALFSLQGGLWVPHSRVRTPILSLLWAPPGSWPLSQRESSSPHKLLATVPITYYTVLP